MKENAKEYLKEFAVAQDDWLKAIIYEAIETNGEISEERKKEIFKNLNIGTTIVINEPNINTGASESEICIKKLKHNQCVNALKEQQTIKFNNDVTILYGMNGAGKSSYFKILNEIIGGNQPKEILPNIYIETHKPMDVEISFEEQNGQKHTVNWNGTNRSLNFLNRCTVFDSSYLNGLLETRKADSTLIQPLGLNLFSYIVNLVDDFKDRLIKEADAKRIEKPVLNLERLSNELKSAFNNHHFNQSILKQVEGFYHFTEENATKFAGAKKELANLKQVNIQDKIKLRNNDKLEVENIKIHITNTQEAITVYISKAGESIKEYLANIEANKAAKKQFEVLTSIPSNNTEEWKEFIRAGEKYSAKLESDVDICPYCRQPLQDDNTIQILNAYGGFLRDKSEQDLNNSTNKIGSLKNELDKVAVKLSIKDSIKTLLYSYKEENSKTSIVEEIEKTISEFATVKKSLADSLIKKETNTQIRLQEAKALTDKLTSIIESIKADINKLSQEDAKKKEKIAEVEKIVQKLMENESVSKQKVNITKWFEINTIEVELRNKASKLNTRKISELSKIAHNDLLTETLKTNFIEELSGLGYNNLDVQIENARGQKGTSNTKITLTKSNDIKLILSEGEQKAVALALFIAEAKIQKSLNPIILDDPVNSLDHRIAGKFAERLLKLENQIILFNHHKLFLEAFETSRENHICKTIDTDCNKSKGKHIRIYQVSSEGRNSKGVLMNYKANKAKNHIINAKNLINKSPFDDSLKVANLVRKAVECTIDEVVLFNQSPTKNSTKSNHIDWDGLKNLNNDSNIIDSLKTIHGRVSGGEMHNGTENEENPIEVQEFNRMISDIEGILQN